VSNDRDYDREAKDSAERKYAYRFDFDVMHSYMIRSFEPHFVAGSLLELGSFRGDFTERLLAHFDDVTCVEASAEAIAEAKQRLGTAPAQALHVGDEPSDEQGAGAAGMRFAPAPLSAAVEALS
jgi:phosphoglycolate phosphatase-like HAD superfamily hydrolase